MSDDASLKQDEIATEPDEPPTWEGEIRGFFTQMDIGCMRSAASTLDLGNYDDVKENAESIHERVDEGTMPLGGRRWSEGKVRRFRQWTDAGCPRGTSAEQGE